MKSACFDKYVLSLARGWLCLSLALVACTEAPIKTASPVEGLSAAEYSTVVSHHTRKINRYSGFHQTFQADVTILDTAMTTAMLRQKAQFFEWDQRQYQAQREKAVQESGAYSKFFLRYYSPERDYDDLSKPKTIWKVYLDYNGNRFEGKVRKLTEKLIEIQALFPHMDRFSSAYEITFNVPMSTIEQGASKVTLTSSLGTAEFSFPVQ